MSTYTNYYIEIKDKGVPTEYPHRNNSGKIIECMFPDALDLAHTIIDCKKDVEYVTLRNVTDGKRMYRLYGKGGLQKC
jgi:hypothetical protein